MPMPTVGAQAEAGTGSVSFFELAADQVMDREAATSEASGLLIEMSDV